MSGVMEDMKRMQEKMPEKAEDRIDAFAMDLYQQIAARRLDFAELLPGEAQVLGGYLMPESPIFVLAVAAALRDRPELYPNQSTSAAELFELQGRATAWAFLKNHLIWLLKVVSDSGLKDQATANKKALAVVRQVQIEDELPYRFGLPDIADRRQAILPAIEMLVDRQQQKNRQGRKTRDARRPAQGLPAIEKEKERDQDADLRWRADRRTVEGAESGPL